MTSNTNPEILPEMQHLHRIGLGGGCHWCTEAVFQHVSGVFKVEQGWIASSVPHDSLSEAVILHYMDTVSLEKLIEIHLSTHSSESSHSMRAKYRSAIYYFDEEARLSSEKYLRQQSDQLVTAVLPFVAFKKNKETYLDYYRKNPDSPFCQRYIEPKLEKVKLLQRK
jgi:peptide-methionine (S)-S-oxide reductase